MDKNYVHVHSYNNCNILNKDVSSNLTKFFFLLVNNWSSHLAELKKNLLLKI